MGSKSKAKAKIVKPAFGGLVEKTSFDDAKENFEAFKKVTMYKLQTMQVIVDRPDWAIALIEDHRHFFNDEPTNINILNYVEDAKAFFENLIKVVENIEFDDCRVEGADPFKGTYKKISECATKTEMFDEFLKYNLVRPYAEDFLKVNKLCVEAIMPEVENGNDEVDNSTEVL